MNIPRVDGSAPLPERHEQHAQSATTPATSSSAKSNGSISRTLATEVRTQLNKLGGAATTKNASTVKAAKAERRSGDLTSQQNLQAAAESLLFGEDLPELSTHTD